MSTECTNSNPILYTPVATRSNFFISRDEQGVLVRSTDIFDNFEGPELDRDFWKRIAKRDGMSKIIYLPASYLHRSIRNPNALFFDKSEASKDTPGIAVLVGTKYKRRHPENADSDHNNLVDCTLYYPSDAATMSRGVLEEGQPCIPNMTQPLCTTFGNGTNICMTASNSSSCGECTVPGNMTGWMLGQLVKEVRRGKKIFQPIFWICWYRDLQQVIAASNAMWRDRELWFRWGATERSHAEFQGWTECTATYNIRDKHLLDAVVVTIGMPMLGNETSICDFDNMTIVQERLQHGYDTGFGSLPVLFYREIRGEQNDYCLNEWGNFDCSDGWQKEFFAQEYAFDNGACLVQPKRCAEVYYFPNCGLASNSTCEDHEGVAALVASRNPASKLIRADDIASDYTNHTEFKTAMTRVGLVLMGVLLAQWLPRRLFGSRTTLREQ